MHQTSFEIVVAVAQTATGRRGRWVIVGFAEIQEPN